MAKRLFVGNISFSTTPESIQQFFQSEGVRISNIKIITDRDTGRSRGFAFVEVDGDKEANKAIENLNGAVLDGRTIAVSEAHERERSGGGNNDRRRDRDDGRRGGRY